jgi:hypothetical protein
MPLIFASLWGFIGTLLSRVLSWFMAGWMLGTVRSIAIYVAMIVAVSFAVYNFVQWVNNSLLELINSMPAVAQANVLGILAMMPKNLPYLVTMILTYYTLSIGAHITVEIAKYKARWAESSISGFGKK